MLKIRPINLKAANAYIEQKHRHHKPVVGQRFSLSCMDGDILVGVAICGRPVARGCDPLRVLEVTRLCTDGTKHACSMLYAAAARVARDMGFERIQTYILEDEPGTSVKAAGWTFDGMTKGGDWNNGPYKGTRRTDQPMGPKQRWIKVLT